MRGRQVGKTCTGLHGTPAATMLPPILLRRCGAMLAAQPCRDGGQHSLAAVQKYAHRIVTNVRHCQVDI